MPTSIRRVLIVDDELSIRQMLACYFSKIGWEAVAVKGGEEAFQAFKLGRFEAILADVDLHEEIDGIEVARRLLNQDPALKVVIMSGRSHHAERVKEARVGAFLVKPFDVPEIGRLLCCEP